MSREDVDAIERAICPGEGACGGMYTANTMASAAEALGMSLPGSAAPPATDRRRDGFARRSGQAVVELLRRGITARDILTKEAFENAIAVVMAFGGSTNAVLHLLAIAHEAGVKLTLEDFTTVGSKVPHLADVKPFGKHVMTDVDRIGGVPVVMKALLDAGLLHGDCLTVTGQTMAQNLAHIAPPDPDGKVLRALSNPIHPTGGITILGGTLAPEGAVVKSAGFDSDVFEGTARVFERERAALDALEDGTITAGDVVVIRYEGPKGGPGMREMLAITGAIKGAGLGKDVLLMTDGRFSGGTTGRARRSGRIRRAQGRFRAIAAALHNGRARKVHQAGRIGGGRSSLRLSSAHLCSICVSAGSAFVPYSPLGHGFLTGVIRSMVDLDDDDWRKTSPRFMEAGVAGRGERGSRRPRVDRRTARQTQQPDAPPRGSPQRRTDADDRPLGGRSLRRPAACPPWSDNALTCAGGLRCR
jgi:hypothetical protein